MNNLRTHIKSCQTKLETISSTILKLTSSSSSSSPRQELSARISELRREIITTMHSFFFINNNKVSIFRRNNNNNKSTEDGLGLVLSAIKDASSNASSSTTTISFEADVRFLLTMWDSIDETVKKVFSEVKEALLFFDSHETSSHLSLLPNNKNNNSGTAKRPLISVVSETTVSNTENGEEVNNENSESKDDEDDRGFLASFLSSSSLSSSAPSSLSSIWNQMQQKASLSIVNSLSDEHDTTNLPLDVLYRIFILREIVMITRHQRENPEHEEEQDEEEAEEEDFDLISIATSIALRRGLYLEVATLLKQLFFDQNLMNTKFFSSVFSSIFSPSSSKNSTRIRTETVSRFISLIAHSSEALTQPVLTARRFANEIVENPSSSNSGENDDEAEIDTNFWISTIFLHPIEKCTLDRESSEFLILGVIPQIKIESLHHQVAMKVMELVGKLWSHNNDEEEENTSSTNKNNFHKPANSFSSTSSSFIHSSSVQSTWSLISSLMAMLQLSKLFMQTQNNNNKNDTKVKKKKKEEHDDDDDDVCERFRHFYATMIIMSSTSFLLKGISFRLSALNRLTQKQGALVASLYFEVSGLQLKLMNEVMAKEKKEMKDKMKNDNKREKDAANDDDDEDDDEDSSKQITPPKFDQFPNLLEEYVRDERTIWSMVAETTVQHSSSATKEETESILEMEEKTQRVKEMMSRKHRMIARKVGEKNDEEKSSTENRHQKYWFLPSVLTPTPKKEEKRRLLLHPCIHNQNVLENFIRSSPRTSKIINIEKLQQSTQELNQRIIQEQVEIKKQNTKSDTKKKENQNNNDNDDMDDENASLYEQDQIKMRQAVSSLRELETKLTTAETNSTSATVANEEGPDAATNKSPLEIGEEAMKELPLVLEKIFTRNNTIALSRAGTFFQQVRSHTVDPAVVVRLFMLAIASSFSGMKGEVSVSAASAAGWCFAVLPSTILSECEKVLNGSDFALVHKLRSLNSIQVGMARLAETKVVDGSAMIFGRRETSNKEDEVADDDEIVVYPPLPGSKQPFLNKKNSKSSKNGGEGIVRWKSVKLSQEYKERERVAKSSIYRNQAVHWAVQAIETVLMTRDRLPSNFSSSNNSNTSNIKIPGWNDDDENEKQQQNNKNKTSTFKLLQIDPDGGLTLEALRTVTLITNFVSRSSASVSQYTQVLDSIAMSSIECLFALATTHFLPAVRINALVCLSSVLKFPETRRNVLFSNSANMFDKLTTALFLGGISKLANEDPDTGVRFVAGDLAEMLMVF